ncbi:MAG TPA: GDP-mannose 4,6-dehydratase, partial [Spirochaetota bacterium]|nr:GDP-mannose 4,6-dehydratase [Spirochaetota bacterium]
NLVETVRELDIQCRILSVGSSEEYGNVTKEILPLKEGMPLIPTSPYAVARLSQEWLSKVFCNGYGLDIIMTRSFNHIGPRQKDIFVIPSFAKQIMEIKSQGKKEGVLMTGDLSVIRDFLDVRDVVVAYDLLFSRGITGEIYNICSGNGISLMDVIAMISDIAGVSIHTETDKSLLRPTDNKIVFGSNAKIQEHTGWAPSISLKQSLTDVLQYWEHVLYGR